MCELEVQVLELITCLILGAVLPVTSSLQTGTGSLRVKVRIRETSNAIPGAQVTLNSVVDPSAGVTLLPENESDLRIYLRQLLGGMPTTVGAVVGTAVADSQGNAVFQDLLPGKYSVAASHDGYINAARDPIEIMPFAPGVVRTFRDSVTIVPDQRNAEISLFLIPAASISGRVFLSSGAPAPYVAVTLGVVRDLEDGRQLFLPGLYTRADALGMYRLAPLGDGEYRLRAGIDSNLTGPDLVNATSVTVKPSEEIVGIDIHLTNVP
jgi:hypothetical protein